jgi:hypothetical protein
VPFNTAAAVTLGGSDPDVPPLPLTYSVTAQPSHGTLSGTPPNLTYKPATNYQGSDSFKFTVSNGTKTSASATVSLTVTAGTPFATSQSVNVAHNAATALTLTGSDPDNPAPPLTYAVATQPSHGTLTGTPPNLTYTPATGYQGSDSFTFTVNNGTHTSTAGTVTLTVAAGTPVATAQTVDVAHNGAASFTLGGVDPDNPALALTYAVATQPAHGMLSGTAPNLTYTPATNYQGNDSFTFTVSNVAHTSTAATVAFVVAAGVPAANNQSVTVDHNTGTAVTLTGTDPDIPALTLTYSLVSQPSHGALSGSGSRFVYTPNTNYQGSDSFTFTTSNGTGTSSPATVALTVLPGVPTATTQTVSVAYNTPAGLTLSGSDPNVPALALTYTVATLPLHGTLSGTAPSLTYTPSANYHGSDSFTFTTSNGAYTSDAALVTLTVAPGTPVASNQTVTIVNDAATAIKLTGSDMDVPALALTYSIATTPSHGTLAGTPPNLTYTPAAGYQGGDSFTFTASNGTHISLPATVTLTISAGVPAGTSQTLAVAHNTAKAITLSGSDPDIPARPLTYTVATQPSEGTLTGTPPNLTYTPTANYQGSDSFTFTASNGTNTSAPATVALTVAPGVPAAISQTLPAALNLPAAITLTGSDPDVPALPLTYILTTQPIHGTLSGTAPNLTYTSLGTFMGPDSFTFTVSNGTNISTKGTVTVSVGALGTLPSFIEGPDQYVAQDAGPQTVPGWATAISPGSSPSEAGLPVNFLVSVDHPQLFSTQPAISSTGTLTYTPAPDGDGIATVTVMLHDSAGTSAAQTFTIAVTTYADAAGTYNGLAQPLVTGTGAAGTPGGNALTGLLRLTSKTNGLFSGSLKLGGTRYPLSGHFDKAGTAHFGKTGVAAMPLSEAGEPDLTLALTLALGTGTDKLNGTLMQGGNAVAIIDADRALYTAHKNPAAPMMNVPAGLLGQYTVVFAALTPAEQGLAASQFPQGDGVAKLTVAADGNATISGYLADGTRISYTNSLSKTNTWPLYIPLAKGQGSISTQVTFEDLTNTDLDGMNAQWYLPAQPKSATYPGGWPNGILVNVIGSKYIVPAGVASVLPGLSGTSASGNADVEIAGADVTAPGISDPVNVAANNKVVLAPGGTDKLTLTIQKTTGVVTGSFTDPATTKPVSIHAAIFQKQQAGFGFFLDGGQSGSVSVAPK